MLRLMVYLRVYLEKRFGVLAGPAYNKRERQRTTHSEMHPTVSALRSQDLKLALFVVSASGQH